MELAEAIVILALLVLALLLLALTFRSVHVYIPYTCKLIKHLDMLPKKCHLYIVSN